MRIVRYQDEDQLVAKIWVFDTSGTKLRLTSYHEASRKTKRHAFSGPCWDWIDERPYCSQLDRPTEIPSDVIEEAYTKMIKKLTVYIGWISCDCVIGYVGQEGFKAL